MSIIDMPRSQREEINVSIQFSFYSHIISIWKHVYQIFKIYAFEKHMCWCFHIMGHVGRWSSSYSSFMEAWIMNKHTLF